MVLAGDTGTHTACYTDVIVSEGWADVCETPCEGQESSNPFEAWTCNDYLSNLGCHTRLLSRTSQPSSRFVSQGLHLSSSCGLSSLATNELPFLTRHALALPTRRCEPRALRSRSDSWHHTDPWQHRPTASPNNHPHCMTLHSSSGFRSTAQWGPVLGAASYLNLFQWYSI